MESSTPIFRYIAIGIAMVIIICCLAVGIYKNAEWNEAKKCYAALAEEYHAEPDYVSIGNAILVHLQPELSLGISQSETHSLLSKIAPISIESWGYVDDNALKEFIYLKTCKFSENSLVYLTKYSNDGRLITIRIYVND
ncbi:MAG: hypothetical protein IT308_05020 [Anaerolineaceae bacterium]|nr:hypothetical protein [Anaerolineaceae bacterium]